MKKLIAISLVALMMLGALASCSQPVIVDPNAPLIGSDNIIENNNDQNANNGESEKNEENNDENVDDGENQENNENTDNGNNQENNGSSDNDDNQVNNGSSDNNENQENSGSGENDPNANGGNNNANDDNDNTEDKTDGDEANGKEEDTACDHSGNENETEATCITETICSVCDKPFGGLDEGNHEGEEEWLSTKEGHKLIYSCCKATIEEQVAHSFVDSKCTVCEYECTVHESDGHSCKICKKFVAHTYSNNKCTKCGLDLGKATIKQGDTISFGSYPQSKVSGSFTAGTWVVHNKVWYTDITSNNVKYRGVKTSENGTISWFKYEPIEWRVLEVKDGKALIMSDLVIDAQAYQSNVTYADGDEKYHKEYSYNASGTYANNYEDSTIRNWLITTFYESAFNDLQKEVIALTKVENDDNAIGDYSNGNKFFCSDTEDKIFLLSKGEVKNTSYGFTYVKNETTNSSRQLGTSDYSYAVIKANGYEPTSGAWWWMRTPTYSSTKDYKEGTNTVTIQTPNKSDTAQNIKVNGTIWSTVVTEPAGGVVPTMWIQL